MSELISRQLLDLWNKYKPTIAVDAIEFDRELRQLLGTNLAEVGTDAVSRKAVKELAYSQIRSMYCGVALKEQRETMLRIADNVIGLLAPVASKQPEIIYCKDCSKHNKRIGDYVENSDGTYYWIWKGQACPLAEFRGVAQGHEFDYQFCAYGERRTE